MSDRKRPQLAPEVLEHPSTQSVTGIKPDKEKEPRSFTTDNMGASTEQVRQPLPKAVVRPIVEIAPPPTASAETANAQPVREPLPKPVARPIVEVVAAAPHIDTQRAEPLPKAVARPIVEIGPHIGSQIGAAETANAQPVREPLPKPVARPIVEVVAAAPLVERQDRLPSREPLPKAQTRPIVEVAPAATYDTEEREPQTIVAAASSGDKVKK